MEPVPHSQPVIVHKGTARLGELIAIVAVIAAVVLLVWGYIEVLRKKKGGVSELGHISGQIRGFGHIGVSGVVLLVGMAVSASLLQRAMKR